MCLYCASCITGASAALIQSQCPVAPLSLVPHWAANDSNPSRKRNSSAFRHVRYPHLSVLSNSGSDSEHDCIFGAVSSTVRHLPRRLITSCGVHRCPVSLLATAAFAAKQSEDICPCHLKNIRSTPAANSSELGFRELQHEDYHLTSSLSWRYGVDSQSQHHWGPQGNR